VHRRRHSISITALVTLLLSPSLAAAEDAMQASADIDGDGQPETVALRPGADERHVLVVDGRVTEHETPSARVVGSTGTAELRPIEMAGNRRAALYRAPLQGEGLAYEAVLFIGRGGAPSVVWAGVTGLRGDRGSRWGDRVIVDDLDGDGHSDVLVAAVAEEVPLCGVDQPELFPRALNPATGQLSTVILNRMRGLQVDEVSLEASRTNPGTLAPTPMLQVASFAIASTNVGDRGSVEGLAAPRALADGDRSTAWIEGRPTKGTGEFVTARLLPGPYQVKALALTLSPAAPSGSDQPNPGPQLGRLRTFTVLIGTQDGLHRFLVTVPEDPASYPGEPVWVQLPEPLTASCLSVVLGDVFGGRRAPSSTAIAEIEVFTDLDFEGGPERLLQALREGHADVEVVLRALGARAVPLIQEQWSDLDLSARRRTARVLASLEDASAAPLLVEAALGPDERTAREAAEGVIALGDEALAPLAEGLQDESAPRRARAAELMGQIGTVAAAERLVERLVSGPPEQDDAALERALHQALSSAGDAARAATIEGIAHATGSSRRVLLSALAPVEPSEREAYARAVIELWQEATTFEDRYRVLTLAGGGGSLSSLIQMVSGVLRSDEDRYLRAHAAEVLGQMGSSDGAGRREATDQLSQGASDEWTGVRLAVANALGRVDPAMGRSTLTTLMSDRWPVVRAAALESIASRGVDSGSLAPVSKALSDRSHVVQIAAARLLGASKVPGALEPLRTLALDDDQHVEARQEAARAIGQLCSSQAQAALVELLGRGLEDRRTPDQVRVAAAAASALASFHSAEVGQLLTRASRGGPVGLRLAAIESLGIGGHPGAREVLQALTQDPMPPLRAAAASALRNLENATERTTCPE